jgi:hypothetical protein
MFSQDFSNWIKCLAWVPADQLDPLKTVRTIRNHVNLTFECDHNIPTHSLANVVKELLDIDTDVSQAGQKLKLILRLVYMDAQFDFEINSNPSKHSHPVHNKIAYTLQGYMEIVNPTSIESQYCKLLIEDSGIEYDITKFAECWSALQAGIRRGSLEGEQLEYMKNELSQFFVHVIDPHLEGDQSAMNQAHNPQIFEDFVLQPSQTNLNSLGYLPDEKC